MSHERPEVLPLIDVGADRVLTAWGGYNLGNAGPKQGHSYGKLCNEFTPRSQGKANEVMVLRHRPSAPVAVGIRCIIPPFLLYLQGRSQTLEGLLHLWDSCRVYLEHYQSQTKSLHPTRSSEICKVRTCRWNAESFCGPVLPVCRSLACIFAGLFSSRKQETFVESIGFRLCATVTGVRW